MTKKKQIKNQNKENPIPPPKKKNKPQGEKPQSLPISLFLPDVVQI